MRHAAATRTSFGDVFEGVDLQRLFGRVGCARVCAAAARWRHRRGGGASSDLDLVAHMIGQFRGVTRELIGCAV